MDVFFVDDFAKAVTNIELWNVPPSAFELGGHVAFFLLPQDGSETTICQVRYSPSTYTDYSLDPPYSPTH